MFAPSTTNHASIGKGKPKEILGEFSVVNLSGGESGSRAESLKATRERVRLSIDTYKSSDLGVNKGSAGSQGVGDPGESGGAASGGEENLDASAGVRWVLSHASMSVASAVIAHLQEQFAAPEFHRLSDDLQVAADNVRLLEKAESRLMQAQMSALQSDVAYYQAEVHNLCRQVRVQVELLSEADQKILDLSGTLSQAQGNESTIDKWGRKVAEVKVEKLLADAHVKKAIEMLKGIGDDGKDAEISIETAIAVLECALPENDTA